MPPPKVVATTCVLVILHLGVTLGVASAQCPPVGQIMGLNNQLNNGLQNGAHVTIQVVGSSLQQGDAKIQAAANDWTKIQGSTYNFTLQNVASVQSATASASNPVVIMQVGPAGDFAPNAGCSGAFMCSQPSQLDSAGNVVIAQVELNPNYTTDNLFFSAVMTTNSVMRCLASMTAIAAVIQSA